MKQTSISNLNTKTAVNDDDYLIIDNLSSTNKILAKTILDTCKQELLDKLYPIGSIYMSVNSANPNTLFGGSWEKVKDRFLLASGDTYIAGDTGGEVKHTLTANELPNLGKFLAWNWKDQANNHTGLFKNGGFKTLDRTMPSGNECGENWINVKGGEQPHNNMPPYLVVNIWKRTA